MNIDDKNIISSEFGHDSMNCGDEDKMYVDAGQAAIIRPNGKVTQLATDKVVGCVGLIMKNSQDGSMGLVHVLANLSFSDLSEEWDSLIKPTIDSLAPDGQKVEVKMFGGLYPDENSNAGDHFVNTIAQRLGDLPNINVSGSDIGNVPHPSAVVINVDGAGVTPASVMVSSYDDVIRKLETGEGNLVDMSRFSKPDIPVLSFGLIYDERVSKENNIAASHDVHSLNV